MTYPGGQENPRTSKDQEFIQQWERERLEMTSIRYFNSERKKVLLTTKEHTLDLPKNKTLVHRMISK